MYFQRLETFCNQRGLKNIYNVIFKRFKDWIKMKCLIQQLTFITELLILLESTVQ